MLWHKPVNVLVEVASLWNKTLRVSNTHFCLVFTTIVIELHCLLQGQGKASWAHTGNFQHLIWLTSSSGSKLHTVRNMHTAKAS